MCLCAAWHKAAYTQKAALERVVFMEKIKASYHAGKGYVLHNMHFRTKRDKGNIDYDRTSQNKVWTRYKDMANVVEAEKRFYNEKFTEELEMQNTKYRKKGNYSRVRTMDDWMKAERHRPVENILQIGDMNCHIDAGDLWSCYVKFTAWRNERYGNHLALISATMHVDESTSHIHERYVLHYKDAQGVLHTGMKKSLEAAGVELFDPSKPEGQFNNRKMTFDAECREKWLDIVEQELQNYKDVELDRTVDLERKQSRIKHMGVDSWRAYQGAMNRVSRTVYILKKKEEELREKEDDIIMEREQLNEDAERLRLAAEQQDANLEDIAARMDALAVREKELVQEQSMFRQKVDDAARRRIAAEGKYGKIREELRRHSKDPDYAPWNSQ